MTKRIRSVTIDNEIKNDIVLVDDIWGVIGSLIPWCDIDTLVRFARVCRDAIRWIQAGVETLSWCLTLNYASLPWLLEKNEKMLCQVVETVKRSKPREFYDDICKFVESRHKRMTQEQLNNWGKIVLAIANYIRLFDRYIYSRNFFETQYGRLESSIPDDMTLSHVFYINTRNDRLEPFYLRKNVSSIQIAKRYANHNEDDTWHFGSDLKTQVPPYAIRHKKAEKEDPLIDVRIKGANNSFSSIHSNGIITKRIRSRLFYYVGDIDQATKAYWLCKYQDIHRYKIKQLCNATPINRVSQFYESEEAYFLNR